MVHKNSNNKINATTCLNDGDSEGLCEGLLLGDDVGATLGFTVGDAASASIVTAPPPHAATAYRACPPLNDPAALAAELRPNSDTRWIVLETPCPEEEVVAAGEEGVPPA